MNKKLYIIIFNDDTYYCDLDYATKWHSGNKEQAWEAWKQEMQCELDYNDVELTAIGNAIHKDAIKDALNRYLIKPLNK